MSPVSAFSHCHSYNEAFFFSVLLPLLQEPGGRGCVTKTMASHSTDLLSKLRSQREAGIFCDITLRTNGQSYLAHRAVLAAVSDHFQEIFTEMDSSMKEDIDLTGKTKTPRSLVKVIVVTEPELHPQVSQSRLTNPRFTSLCVCDSFIEELCYLGCYWSSSSCNKCS